MGWLSSGCDIGGVHYYFRMFSNPTKDMHMLRGVEAGVGQSDGVLEPLIAVTE